MSSTDGTHDAPMGGLLYEAIERQLYESLLEARRGKRAAAIQKAQAALRQCETSGAIDLAVHVAQVLCAHLEAAGRGIEAVALAERYQRTAHDCGSWLTLASMSDALAPVWASYGYLDRARASIVGWRRAATRVPEAHRYASLAIYRWHAPVFGVAAALSNLGMVYLHQAGLELTRPRLRRAHRSAAFARRLFRRARHLQWWGRWLSHGHQLNWETTLANEAEALRLQAEVVAARGECGRARALYGEAARLYTAWLGHTQRSATRGGDQLSGAGLAFAGDAQFDQAKTCFAQAIRLAQSYPDEVYHLFVAHKRYGDYCLRQQQRWSAHQHYAKAMTVLEQSPLSHHPSGTRYYGTWERSVLFANAIKTAIALEDYDLAFLDAERSRQEGFRRIVRGMLRPERLFSAEDQARIDRMLAEVLAEQPSQSPPDGHAATAGTTEQDVRKAPFRQSQTTEAAIDQAFEQIAAYVTARVPSVPAIAAAIPDGSAVVAYHVVDEALYAFCLTGSGRPAKPVPLVTDHGGPVTIQELECCLRYTYIDSQTQQRTQPRLHAPRHAKALCSTLYQWLIQPLLPQLAGVTRLYVVPTKPLFGCWAGDAHPLTGVPFAALRDERGQVLIAPDGRFPRGIAYLPCVTPQPVLPPEPDACARLATIFRMADEFPPVQPGPGVEVVEGHLSPVEFLQQLATSRVALCYTHGWARPEVPLLAGLSHTSAPTSASVCLTGMHCLLVEPRAQATVVVTPCSTATMTAEEARVVGGEEMLGFVQPLLRHAETVIGCLWDVIIEEEYVPFSQFLLQRAASTGVIDPIQATADWQWAKSTQCKDPWKETQSWAWPMVWTTLQAASPGGRADGHQEEND